MVIDDTPVNISTGANGGGFGGYGDGLIAILLIFALLGFGRNGFGGDSASGGGSESLGYQLGRTATTEDLASGFSTNAIQGSLGDIKLGQANIQQTLCQGFNGVTTSILQSTNSLQSQLASCCCGLEKELMQNRYDTSTQFCNLGNLIQSQTRDILENNNANTRAILEQQNAFRIQSMQERINHLELAQSQAQQSAFIISQLRTTTTPTT